MVHAANTVLPGPLEPGARPRVLVVDDAEGQTQLLFKPGPQTADEYRLMQTHTLVGDQICKPLRSLERVRPIIRHHHELLDGRGYPDGLKGRSVPLLAQITSVVDIFDGMTTDRPYRRARPIGTALECLHVDAAQGRRDRAVIDEFAAMIQEANPALPADDDGLPAVAGESHQNVEAG